MIRGYLSVTEIRLIHVRDAEVPGSNPGSPTRICPDHDVATAAGRASGPSDLPDLARSDPCCFTNKPGAGRQVHDKVEVAVRTVLSSGHAAEHSDGARSVATGRVEDLHPGPHRPVSTCNADAVLTDHPAPPGTRSRGERNLRRLRQE
jgi:hypothetical protein